MNAWPWLLQTWPWRILKAQAQTSAVHVLLAQLLQAVALLETSMYTRFWQQHFKRSILSSLPPISPFWLLLRLADLPAAL